MLRSVACHAGNNGLTGCPGQESLRKHIVAAAVQARVSNKLVHPCGFVCACMPRLIKLLKVGKYRRSSDMCSLQTSCFWVLLHISEITASAKQFTHTSTVV